MEDGKDNANIEAFDIESQNIQELRNYEEEEK